MHKHVFGSLKSTFVNVSNLPPPFFDKKKTIYKVVGFLPNYDGGRPEIGINVRLRL